MYADVNNTRALGRLDLSNVLRGNHREPGDLGKGGSESVLMFRFISSRLVPLCEDAWYTLPSINNDIGDLQHELMIRCLLTLEFGFFCYRHVP